jgi:hypothetical protein
MSHKGVLEFLRAVRDDPALRARYRPRNMTQLVYHAGNDGFDFTLEEISDLTVVLETNVVVAMDGDRFGATSRLWQRMWGVYHLDYFVDNVVRRHTDDEMQSVLDNR